MNYKEVFQNLWILDTRTDVPGDYVYYPFWRNIRELFVKRIKEVLEENFFRERHFNDIMNEHWVQIMNEKIMDISKSIYRIGWVSYKNKRWGKYYLAPTHEIPITQFMAKVITRESQLPLKFFHIWQAFRKQYWSSFPFNLSKRNTYIECYEILKREWLDLWTHIEKLIQINNTILKDILQLPYIISERPLSTNKPISKKTIGFDVITPLLRTLHAWMIYFHDDIFNNSFDRKCKNENNKKQAPQSIHFWFTDNLLMTTLINWIEDSKIYLPHEIMPNHITYTWADQTEGLKLKKSISKIGINVMIEDNYPIGSNQNKKQYDIINKQTWYIQVSQKNEESYSYRLIWNNERRNWSYWEIIELINKQKQKRIDKLEEKREWIMTQRIQSCNLISEIVESVNKGNIGVAGIENTEGNVHELEKNLDSWEVLGFKKSDNYKKCIIWWKQTNRIAYISKRI